MLIEPATFKIERLLPGPIERVWAYLTESDLRRQWLAAGEMEMKVGAPFEFVWRNDELTNPPGERPPDFGDEHRMKSRITELDPPRKLAFTWDGTGGVSFELEPQGDEVLLTVTHRRVTDRATLRGVGPAGTCISICWSPAQPARNRRPSGTGGTLCARNTNSVCRPDAHEAVTNTEEIAMDSQTAGLPPAMNKPPIVSPQEWEAALRTAAREGEGLTRARDALAAERRRMPWLAVEKAYKFEGPDGKASLLDLFEGRRQLIVYRAFFEPGVQGWPEHACIGCSMVADQVAHVAHLNARDTTLVFASRAPQADIARLKARMGWEMPWYTVTDGFDKDFGVDEWHGTNAFIRDGDKVFRTYFINSRGDEAMGSTWSYLDITALGRQEEWEDSPKGYPQTKPYQWWIWHDQPGANEHKG